MKSILLAVIILLSLVPAHAQEIMGFDVSEIFSSISTGLKGVGLVPDLDGVDSEQTKAFVIVIVLLWMVYNIAIGLPDLPSAILAFFTSSFLFNKVPSLFVSSAAESTVMGLFEHTFSALFVFIWVDYILHYVWALSRTTKLFVNAAVTMMAVMFMNFTNIFVIMKGWIDIMLSTTGFILFLIFMMGMRIFNTYFSMMNIRSARTMRRGAGAGYTMAKKAAQETVEQQKIGNGGK